MGGGLPAARWLIAHMRCREPGAALARGMLQNVVRGMLRTLRMPPVLPPETSTHRCPPASLHPLPPARHGLPETSDTIFLMYSSFFQPLIREVLPSVLQQLLTDERQVQVGGRAGRGQRAESWSVEPSAQKLVWYHTKSAHQRAEQRAGFIAERKQGAGTPSSAGRRLCWHLTFQAAPTSLLGVNQSQLNALPSHPPGCLPPACSSARRRMPPSTASCADGECLFANKAGGGAAT